MDALYPNGTGSDVVRLRGQIAVNRQVRDFEEIRLAAFFTQRVANRKALAVRWSGRDQLQGCDVNARTHNLHAAAWLPAIVIIVVATSLKNSRTKVHAH